MRERVLQNRSGTWRARMYVGGGKHVALGSLRMKTDAERASSPAAPPISAIPEIVVGEAPEGVDV